MIIENVSVEFIIWYHILEKYLKKYMNYILYLWIVLIQK